MTQHAILAPSSAPMWANCAGSVPIQAQQPPQAETPENMEGNAAHWMAATQLKQMVQFGQVVPFKEGTACPNGVVITDELIQSAELFVDEVVEDYGSDAIQGGALHIEEHLTIHSIHPDNDGTPDVWWAVIGATGAYVHIWDFKNGFRFCDAFENWQLIDYVAGILERPELAGIDRSRIQVCMSIVQPRSYDPMGPVRHWAITADKLAPYFDRLRAAALNARGNSPVCVPGDWCYDCTGARACKTLQLSAYAAMDLAGTATTQNMTPDALAIELRMMQRAEKILGARVSALEEQATSILKGRGVVPGYEIEQGFGREAWTRPPEEVFALGDMMGIDVRKPQSPVTPAQARKAGLTKELVAGYAAQPIGKLKLKPVNTNQARRVFSK